MAPPRTARRTHGFTESVIREVTQASSGRSRVGGTDINRARHRAVMQAALALSTSSELAAEVRTLLDDETYSPSRADYDLRKLRSKGLVSKIPRSRRYRVEPFGLRTMAALLLLRDKVLRPLLASASRDPAAKPRTTAPMDRRYTRIHEEVRGLLTTLGMAA